MPDSPALDVAFYVADEQGLRNSLEKSLAKMSLEPKASVFENAIILPTKRTELGATLAGGVILPTGDFLAGHSRHESPQSSFNQDGSVILRGYLPDRVTVKRDETVIWGGSNMQSHFGHILMELFSRLWYTTENPNSFRIVFQQQWLPDFAYDLLDLAGIGKKSVLLITEPTQFKSVIIPEQCLYLHSARSSLPKIKTVFDSIRANVPKAGSDKVYLSRTKLGKKTAHLSGEEYFEQFYADHGYQIVHPQLLPIAEQISVISAARH